MHIGTRILFLLLVIAIAVHNVACSVGEESSGSSHAQGTAALGQEPFVFEKSLPAAPEMKVIHQNRRDDANYYQYEVVFHGSSSLESLERFYTQFFEQHGLRVADVRRQDNSTTFMVWGWPDDKIISLSMIDHSLLPRYPDMVYQKTDHPAMQYRSVNASISKRKN